MTVCFSTRKSNPTGRMNHDVKTDVLYVHWCTDGGCSGLFPTGLRYEYGDLEGKTQSRQETVDRREHGSHGLGSQAILADL